MSEEDFPGFAPVKAEGKVIHYDGGEPAVFKGDGMGGPSYWVEMCIDPNEGWMPSTVKETIQAAIAVDVAYVHPSKLDEHLYQLIKKIVGEYISKDMIMRLST